MARRYTKVSATFLEIAVVAILFCGMAAVAFWQLATSFVAQDANSGGPFDNAAMFPRLVAWRLLLLSGIEITRLLIRWHRGGATDGAGQGGLLRPGPEDESLRVLTYRALACSGVFMVYLIALTPIGYIASTPVLIAAMAMILGARFWVAILVAVTATTAIGIVFATILNVVLPVGRLGLPTLF